MMKVRVAFFLFLLFSSSFSLTLREAAENKNIFIGSAANHDYFGIKNYTSVLAQQYNLITPEVEMKWRITEPNQGNFSFEEGDLILSFAQKANQVVRGHNLCWGDSNPLWLENGNFTSLELHQILQLHINSVVGHYKGQLYSWDVVNEAVLDKPNSTDYLKSNVWFPAIPNYVDLAFQWARAADPSVKLFYNDYNAEGSGSKSDAVYNMLKSMKQRGIPVDGVGLQYHVSTHYSPDPADVLANMQRLAALGLEIHVTEMDVGFSGTNITSELQIQAQIYSNALAVCLKVSNCKSFETWGFTDKFTWLGSNREPLPFNIDYEPKPAVSAMLDLLE